MVLTSGVSRSDDDQLILSQYYQDGLVMIPLNDHTDGLRSHDNGGIGVLLRIRLQFLCGYARRVSMFCCTIGLASGQESLEIARWLGGRAQVR